MKLPNQDQNLDQETEQQAANEEAAVSAAVDALLAMRNSEGWAILMAQLHKDVEEAKEEFEGCDVTDVDKMRKIQNRITRARWFEDTPQELILSGASKEELAQAEAELVEDGQEAEE